VRGLNGLILVRSFARQLEEIIVYLGLAFPKTFLIQGKNGGLKPLLLIKAIFFQSF
jgi:hypothetical protein